MSVEARARVIELVSEELTFPFKEQDLSPKTRVQIGAEATKIDQAWELQNGCKSHELFAQNLGKGVFFAGVIGIFTMIIAITLESWVAAVIGLMFLGAIYLLYKQYRTKKKKAEHFRSEADELWALILEDVDQLSKVVLADLSSVYEARVRPTVKHFAVDFATIIKVAKGGGLILDKVECPYCRAAVDLPDSGVSFKCPYCGKTIRAINIFDKLNDILK